MTERDSVGFRVEGEPVAVRAAMHRIADLAVSGHVEIIDDNGKAVDFTDESARLFHPNLSEFIATDTEHDVVVTRDTISRWAQSDMLAGEMRSTVAGSLANSFIPRLTIIRRAGLEDYYLIDGEINRGLRASMAGLLLSRVNDDDTLRRQLQIGPKGLPILEEFVAQLHAPPTND